MKNVLKVAIVLLLCGCANINQEKDESANVFQLENTAGTGIAQSKAYRISIIEKLMRVERNKLDSLTAIQKKFKKKSNILEKRIEEAMQNYNRLQEEIESFFISHASS